MTYTNLRQFQTALKLYDRALDIMPNDPDLMGLRLALVWPRVTYEKLLRS